MKWLLDANIPYSAKNVFPSDDNVLHVEDIGFAAAADEAIFDFANILHFPVRNHPGVVVLKLPSFYNADAIKRALRGFLAVIDKKELKGALVTVEEGRYRVRVETE